jgi:transcription termination factor NusB
LRTSFLILRTVLASSPECKPPAASINEAAELAKLLSTEDNERFVNGPLDRVARESSNR